MLPLTAWAAISVLLVVLHKLATALWAFCVAALPANTSLLNASIWQSVWLESVPENFVEALHITSDKKGVTIVADASEEYSIENIRVEIYPATDFSSMLMTQCGWYTNGDLFGVPSASLVNENIEPIMDVSEPSNTIDIDIENPVLWSVENPYIYPVRIYAGYDVVDSYFAFLNEEKDKVLVIDLSKGIRSIEE